MNEEEVVRALAALGQIQRLKIFRALVVAGTEGQIPGVLADTLGIPAPTLSFHLKELTQAGLVTQERSSRNLIYRAAYHQVGFLLGYLTENCCAGESCVVSTSAASTSPASTSQVFDC
jgi:ArsR family transcriptional regulator, arsenate/arsenite/antimonite-responsive transcriptional repressor